MNAVAGIVHLDGGQVVPRDLDVVTGSMGAWGARARSEVSDAACFGFVGPRTGDLPRTCLNGGALITAAARLDNREELLDLLRIGLPSQLNLTDEWLVLHAFERWGEACPERLNGDWSLAVWVPAIRRLFLARDHFGNTGLYYAHCGQRVAFASDIRALLALRWIPRRLDETRIGSMLVGGQVDDAHSTVYRDISRLPPAHTVTIAQSGERLHRYWRVEATPDAGPVTLAERAELLRDTVRAAVTSRVGATDEAGSMLSGGLDSGAVTAFAAEYLSSQGRRLTAFTSVPAFARPGPRTGPWCVDEGPSSTDLVRSFDSIDHVLVPARTVSPVAGTRRGLVIHGEPSVAAVNYSWITEIMADARARGIKRLLTGQMGDFTMSGRPAVPSWRRDWAEGRYRPIVKRLTPNWLLHLRRVDWKPWQLSGVPWWTFSVVNRDFAVEIRLLERLRDSGQDPRQFKLRQGRAGVVRQATCHVGAVWASLGAEFGLSVLDPLQDKRVMEQMFSHPRPQMTAGTDRWLFRQSLVGVLPEPVRSSRWKGLQSSDIVERLVASWAEVEDALAIAEASPLARRCIDVRYWRSLAESIRSTPGRADAHPRACLFLNGLSVALFLAENWEQPASNQAPAV